MEEMREESLLYRINALEEENRRIREVLGAVVDAIQQMNDTVSQHFTDFEILGKRVEDLTLRESVTRVRVDNLPYELSDPAYRLPTPIPRILSIGETRRRLIEEHCSIARFGDGEFAAIAGVQRWRFQRADPVLGKRLREVLQTDEKGLMIGLIPFYGALTDRSETSADGVRTYLTDDIRKQHAALLDMEREYACSDIHRIRGESDIANLREIWQDRDCLFIEGEQTRMGVGNDLFDNCRSIRRIVCPAESAFDRYEEILKTALEQPKDLLVLIALGPTATVLAYDLFHEGFQAIDLGHADLLYDKFRHGDMDMRVRYKYDSINEIQADVAIDGINDPAYDSQIIARIV